MEYEIIIIDYKDTLKRLGIENFRYIEFRNITYCLLGFLVLPLLGFLDLDGFFDGDLVGSDS